MSELAARTSASFPSRGTSGLAAAADVEQLASGGVEVDAGRDVAHDPDASGCARRASESWADSQASWAAAGAGRACPSRWRIRWRREDVVEDDEAGVRDGDERHVVVAAGSEVAQDSGEGIRRRRSGRG
jgi:hypothetical protein